MLTRAGRGLARTVLFPQDSCLENWKRSVLCVCGGGGNPLGMLPTPGPQAPPTAYSQCPRHLPQVALRLLFPGQRGCSAHRGVRQTLVLLAAGSGVHPNSRRKLDSSKSKAELGEGSCPPTVWHRTPAIPENGVLWTNTPETPDVWFGGDLVSIHRVKAL